MGTNYYLRENQCSGCGRAETLHIGKSSYGWCFGLHVIPELGLNDLNDWEDRWTRPGAEIRDEYGATISPEEMRLVIVLRRAPVASERSASFYDRNHAEPGPNGLMRHRIGKGICVGHGEGSWDLISGEFS